MGASTSLFVRRSVRNFGGPRFRRSVHEGFIEDLLIEESEEEEEENYWSTLMKNSTLFQEFNRTLHHRSWKFLMLSKRLSLLKTRDQRDKLASLEQQAKKTISLMFVSPE